MDDVDLDMAFAIERLILGAQLRLECNCILDVLCTMPVTYWVRLRRYDHRCPRHPVGGGNHLLLREPAWVTIDGTLISVEAFKSTFTELVEHGFVTLVHDKRMVSLEGGHYIAPTGGTLKIIP